MTLKNRLSPLEVADAIVQSRFPECDGAVLAGSVIRGEATKTSDLDIVVFDRRISDSYRESFVEMGWPVELFCHNLQSYREFFKSDCERARPCMPRMVSDGMILKDRGIVDDIKKEAKTLLEAGPKKWDMPTLQMKRYFLTDVLEDFIGATNRSEEIFIAGSIAELASEFVLRTNNRWNGTSKWLMRSLTEFDKDIALQFSNAFDLYYRSGVKSEVICLVDDILEPYGGRLFEGFSIGKRS